MATSKTAKPAVKATNQTTKPAPKAAEKAVAKPAAAKAAPAKSMNNGSSSFQPYVAKKGEEYMSKGQLAHFANILGSLKGDLMADIERTVHTMQDEQTVFADPNDRASQETDMALELRNRDRERKLVKKIEETLDRIKADDYGFCDKCGIEIGIQRLEARPTATLCIDCKTLEELREKQVAK
jgi:DnaK suppressor protein